MADIGAVIGEKYEVVRLIGKGGMSSVYLVTDRHLGKRWALKEIQKCGGEPNEKVIINSLLTEADIMKRLDHPALPRIVDIIEEENEIYVVMDYIEGKSLDRVLAERGSLPEKTVLSWAAQICDALLYLHSRNPPIIYRDMKPANVMLCPGGKIRIIDFGIAREYKEKSRSDTTVLGTRGYASPEHYGARQTDIRSDIYTLGMTLHHLLTGVSPRTPGYIYHPVRFWKPTLSAGIETVIDKCTALDPDDRYQNCLELKYDLEHIEHLTENLRGKQIRRVRMFFAAAVLTGLLFTGGLFLREEEGRVSRERYETLVSVIPSLSIEEKLKNYEEAVRMRPDDTTAYLCILDAFEEEGSFGQEQSDEFLSLYNSNRDLFDRTSADTAKLNYRIGTLYFNCYSEEDGYAGFSTRVQKAYPFFEANHENKDLPEDFEDANLSECYFFICKFYRTYVLGSLSGEEAAKGNYLELISVLDECVDSALNVSPYDQLTLYNGIFLLLYDQRENMAAVRVEEEKVLGLLDRVRARSVVLTVQKKQSAALKSEILDHYKLYREAIVRAYTDPKEDNYG